MAQFPPGEACVTMPPSTAAGGAPASALPRGGACLGEGTDPIVRRVRAREQGTGPRGAPDGNGLAETSTHTAGGQHGATTQEADTRVPADAAAVRREEGGRRGRRGAPPGPGGR